MFIMSSTYLSAKLDRMSEEFDALADDDLVNLVHVTTASDGEIGVCARFVRAGSQLVECRRDERLQERELEMELTL